MRERGMIYIMWGMVVYEMAGPGVPVNNFFERRGFGGIFSGVGG